MVARPIVLDANVILRALRSRNGASYVIIEAVLFGDLLAAASTAVLLEYEAVLKRPGILGPFNRMGHDEIDAVLGLLYRRMMPAPSYFRFRPFLDDPNDDIYIECALAAGASVIVTSDRHFRHPALAAFGLRAVSPGDFVAQMWRDEDAISHSRPS